MPTWITSARTGGILVGTETGNCEPRSDKEDFVKELQRLIACYQLASFDDQKVVWAVLNKYAAYID